MRPSSIAARWPRWVSNSNPAGYLANNRHDHHEIALREIGPEAAGMQAKQIRVQAIWMQWWSKPEERDTARMEKGDEPGRHLL